MTYLKGKDGKIKGIENLEGIPDCTMYKTDRTDEQIEAGDLGDYGIGLMIRGPVKKPEGFEGW